MVRVSLGYPTRRRRGGDARAARRARPRPRPRAGDRRGRRCAPRRSAVAAVHGSEALRRYVGRARRGDPHRPAGRARRQPARGADAVPGREGATRRSRGATTRFPTTSRRSRRPCSPTGCCSRPRPAPGDARGGCRATRSSASRPSDGGRPMSAAPTAGTVGAALGLAGLGFGSPSLYVAGVGLLGLAGWRGRLGRARAPAAGSSGCRARLAVVEDEPYPLRDASRGRRRCRRPAASSSTRCSTSRWPIGPALARQRARQGRASRGRGRRRLEPAGS